MASTTTLYSLLMAGDPSKVVPAIIMVFKMQHPDPNLKGIAETLASEEPYRSLVHTSLGSKRIVDSYLCEVV